MQACMDFDAFVEQSWHLGMTVVVVCASMVEAVIKVRKNSVNPDPRRLMKVGIAN